MIPAVVWTPDTTQDDEVVISEPDGEMRCAYRNDVTQVHCAGAQRDAADKLAEIFIRHAFLEALRVILSELERKPLDPATSVPEHEKFAAKRGIELIDSGKWKQHDTWVHVPPAWIREMLDLFARGELSICDPEGASKRRTMQHIRTCPRGRARKNASDEASSKHEEKPRYRLIDGTWREVTKR